MSVCVFTVRSGGRASQCPSLSTSLCGVRGPHRCSRMSAAATTCPRPLSSNGGWHLQSFLGMVFREWRVAALLEVKEKLETITKRWSKKIETMRNSIWHMTRDELVETCIAELGYTRAACSKMLVDIMRLELKEHRQRQKPSQGALPKGLARWPWQQLAQYSSSVGLGIIRESGKQLTRAEMIRNIMKFHEYSPLVEDPTASVRTFPEYDPSQDFEMLGEALPGEEPSASGAKGSGKGSPADVAVAQQILSQIPPERLTQILAQAMMSETNP